MGKKKKQNDGLCGYKITDKYIQNLLKHFNGNIQSIKEYLEECNSRASNGNDD